MLEQAWRYSSGVISQVIIVEYARLRYLSKKNKTIKRSRELRIMTQKSLTLFS